MSKLVDKERLARLAAALDQRAKAAVEAEKGRAMGVEADLQAGIDAINHAETGILKVAKDYVDAEIAKVDAAQIGQQIENLQAEDADIRADFAAADAALKAELQAEIDADVKEVADALADEKDENKAGSLAAKVKAAQADIDAFQEAQATKELEQDAAIAAKVAQADYDAKVQALESKNTSQDQAIDAKVNQDAYNTKMQALDAEDADIRADFAAADTALAGRLDVLEGEGEGSVAKALQDAKDYVDAEIEALDASALEARVQANEGKLAGLEKATVKAEIEAAQAAAEKHADDAITALVDSAPDAMNTLNELAEAIKGNKDIYDEYIAKHATDMAQQKTDLQKEIDDDIAAARTLISAEIDADVKAEADRAKAEEADIRADFAAADTQVLADAKKYADDQDAVLKAALQAEIDADVKVEADRAKGVEAELLAAINAKVSQTDYNAKVADFEGRIAANEAFVEAHDHSGIEGDITALEGKVQTLEEFMNGHSHATMEQGIADNKAAIEQEVEDRDAAIEEALKDYSDTEAVKSMLGAVVNSLSMEMEDNKLKLTLGGGSSAITLKEVSLDMATDDDIDAIISGLDA